MDRESRLLQQCCVVTFLSFFICVACLLTLSIYIATVERIEIRFKRPDNTQPYDQMPWLKERKYAC